MTVKKVSPRRKKALSQEQKLKFAFQKFLASKARFDSEKEKLKAFEVEFKNDKEHLEFLSDEAFEENQTELFIPTVGTIKRKITNKVIIGKAVDLRVLGRALGQSFFKKSTAFLGKVSATGLKYLLDTKTAVDVFNETEELGVEKVALDMDIRNLGYSPNYTNEIGKYSVEKDIYNSLGIEGIEESTSYTFKEAPKPVNL